MKKSFLPKKEKKEICNTDQKDSNQQKLLCLKKFESNYTNLNFNILNIRKRNINDILEIDNCLHKSDNVNEGARSTNDPNNITKRKKRKKTVIASELVCQDNRIVIDSDSSLEEGEVINLNNEQYSMTKKIERSSVPKKSKFRIFDDINVSELQCEETHISNTGNESKKMTILKRKSQLKENHAHELKSKNIKKEFKNGNFNSNEPECEETHISDTGNECKKRTILKRKAQLKENHAHELKPKNIKEKFKNGNLNASEPECEETDISGTGNESKNKESQGLKDISNKDIITKNKSRYMDLDVSTRDKLDEVVKRPIENYNKYKKMITLKRKAQSKEDHAHELKPKDIKEEFKNGDGVLVSSSLLEGEVIDIKNEHNSLTKNIENQSLAKKSKFCLFNNVKVSEPECEVTPISNTGNESQNQSQGLKDISNKGISNKKKSKHVDKQSLDVSARNKLDEMVKGAIENTNKNKKMITLKRKAESKENHEHELKPKDIKEEFKNGDRVLVSSYNGELNGPFIIVEMLGPYSCKLRFLSAVNCGESGGLSSNKNETVQIEYIKNLIPFKKNTTNLTSSIKSSCSNEHLGFKNKSMSIYPENLNTATFSQYQNRNKININQKSKINDQKKYKSKAVIRKSKILVEKSKTLVEKSKMVVDWVTSLKLNSSHKKILLNDECCLTTDIIDSANQLIHKKWPYADGLRTPFQVQCSAGFPAMKSGGVQIIFDEERKHWFTASNMGISVEVADSMLPVRLSFSAKKQIAQCFRDHEENGILKVQMLPVCQQDNAVDCGLYAIANAIEFVCENGDPLSPYIRSEMRTHLIKCFERGEIHQFPKSMFGTAKRSVNQPPQTKMEVISITILDCCNKTIKGLPTKAPSGEIIVELSSDSE